MIRIDLSGNKYGLLTVINLVELSKNGHAKYKCICDCGNEKIVFATALKSGNTLSCGCVQKKRASDSNKTHGYSRSSLYIVWQSMISRCQNKNTKSFKNYGDRGISLCDEWKKFECFYAWAYKNNYKAGISIDRINNNGNYCPENCQLISLSENVKKELSKPVICIDTGECFKSATEASKSIGLSASSVSNSIARNTKSGGYNWRYI